MLCDRAVGRNSSLPLSVRGTSSELVDRLAEGLIPLRLLSDSSEHEKQFTYPLNYRNRRVEGVFRAACEQRVARGTASCSHDCQECFLRLFALGDRSKILRKGCRIFGNEER